MPNSNPPDLEIVENREVLRIRLLRANTALAILLAGTVILAASALWQSLRAGRLQAVAIANQQRAEAAETFARTELRRALFAEAGAIRRGTSMNRREEALESLRRAAAIAPGPELRDEAIVALALPEESVKIATPLDNNVRGYDVDPLLRRGAVGMANGEVVLYDLTDGRETGRLRLEGTPVPAAQGAAQGLTFSNTGRALAVRYQRGALAVWDLDSGRMRFALDADEVRRTSSRGYFSSDDAVLVAPVFTPDGFAAFDAVTGRRLRHFGQFNSYHHCAVRPGTTQFAVYHDGIIAVMDWNTGNRVTELKYPNGARILAWDPDGQTLAIGSNNPHVDLWDVTRNTLTALPGPKDAVVNLYFDESGKRLAAVTLDRTSILWKLPGTRPVGIYERRRFLRWGPLGASAWSVPRQHLEIRRPVVNESYTQISEATALADSETMDVSPDGTWAISKAYPEGLLMWDLVHPVPPTFLGLTNIQSLCFHPNEPKLFLLRNHQLESREITPGIVDGHRTLSLGPPASLDNGSNRLTTLVTISANGRTRAHVESLSGRIWVEHSDLLPGFVEMQKTLHSSVDVRSGSASGSGTIALSPEGNWLAVAMDSGWGTSIFDTRTGGRSNHLAGEMGGVHFSKDGRWLTLVTPRQAQVFRTGDWKEIWSKPGDTLSPHPTGIAAFSPDGRTLALARSSGRGLLVDAETGRELGYLEAPDAAPIRTARWSGDGKRLVFATRENSLDVWQPAGLERELVRMGLDWNAPVSKLSPAILPVPKQLPAGRWIELTLFGATGAIGVVALAFWRRHRHLLTEYSHAEYTALRREKELQVERELHELKTQFVSTVSHEFRTPLGVIMASAENLKDYHDRLSPIQRTEHVHDIIDATRTMSVLMEEVLLLGRVQAGKVTFRPIPLVLQSFCERIIEEVHASTDRRCRIHLHMDLGERPAVGDAGLLRHILTNLLSNGVKYSPAESPVELHVESDNSSAVFTVRDQGIGIPPEDLPHLFNAFHRGHNVGDIAGSGLGMVIVKRCIELHGGTIECHSVVNRGTTFTVRIPLFVRH